MCDRRQRCGAWLGALWAVSVGCGGGPGKTTQAPSAEAPAPVASTATSPERSEPGAGEAAPAPPANPTSALPTECATSGELCLPPRPFVQRLCQDAYMGAALRLFEQRSPFSRGYVRSRAVKAVNTLGGPASDAELRFGEEVIILTHSGGPGAGEMQVSGMGGYEVLRWDGTCATLGEGELARRPPVPPRHAPFEWQWIDESIQKALLQDGAIAEARRQHRKHCHGVTLGRRSAACLSAEATLSERIVTAVRTGMDLPEPDRMP